MASRETSGKDVDLGFMARLTQGVRYAVTGKTPDAWFGPREPIRPLAQEVAGRQLDYQVGYNLQIRPRANEPISFEQMIALADSYDLLRLVIETRKDQIVKYAYAVTPIEEEQEPDERCQEVADFFRYPDREHNWETWLRALVEDMLVIDAATIYPRFTRGGRILKLDLIDGATIKRVITSDGRTPDAPDVAYQQVLHGLPAVDYSADELIYAVRNYRTRRVYGYCYDSATEILTRHRGWVEFAELRDTDIVATRSKDGAFEWQMPNRMIREQWDGDMYHFSSRSMDLMVTPEHRMLVSALPHALGGNKFRRGEAIIAAEELAANLNHEIKIPVTSTWIGEEIHEQVFKDEFAETIIEVERVLADGTVQQFKRRKTPARTCCISGDDFCALMGAYVAEGNIRTQGGIEIAQLETSKGYSLYKELFDRLGGGYNGRSFSLPRRAITKFFSQFGHAHEKFVPELVMNATPRQIRIFWDYYMAGDGHYENRESKTQRGSQPDRAERATTVSRRLADQLVELAQKLGMSASVRIRPACKQRILHYESDCREAYVISCRYSHGMSVKAEKTHYKGTIYCVTVPNGIVYVRRNGKPAWSGNSPVEQVIMTVNIAIRRQLHQLQYYTEGNIPEALIGVPKEWNPDQIRDFQNWFDFLLEGDTAQRRHAKFIPEGVNYHPTKEVALKDPYDEWLARVVCFAFSIPPTPFVREMNRATSESAKEAATEEGLIPLMSWVKNLMDRVIWRYFGYTDIEFKWQDEDPADPVQVAQINDIKIRNGTRSVNEVRAADGMEPAEGGDDPFVMTGAGPVLLKNVANQAELAPGPPPNANSLKGKDDKVLAEEHVKLAKAQKKSPSPSSTGTGQSSFVHDASSSPLLSSSSQQRKSARPRRLFKPTKR